MRPQSRIIPYALRIIIAAIAIYLFLGIILALMQTHILYHPDDTDFEECDGLREYSRVTYNGTRLYMDEFSDKAIVVYHGNAGSACDRSPYAKTFEKTGRSVIFVEYTGYSGDEENPSSTKIREDVRNIVDFLNESGFIDVVVYGQSVGSGAASYHASITDVEGIILVNPFSRLVDVARDSMPIYPVNLLLRERYDNIRWLHDHDGRALIIHGEEDRVIDPRFSKKLFDSLDTAEKRYVLIEGKGHNDIWSSVSFREHIVGFADRTG